MAKERMMARSRLGGPSKCVGMISIGFALIKNVLPVPLRASFVFKSVRKSVQITTVVLDRDSTAYVHVQLYNCKPGLPQFFTQSAPYS
eukprot:SAG22_NODE_1327_length_4730_cov_3.576549_3_plen_88_part_00